MCKTYTIYCRICKRICASNTEHCKDYGRCGDPSKFFKYAPRQCPACDAKDEELFRRKREKERADTAKKEFDGGRLRIIMEEGAAALVLTDVRIALSSSRPNIGPATRTDALVNHSRRQLHLSEAPVPPRRSRIIGPDTVTIETYSPPPSPKCIPMPDPDAWVTTVVPETPAAFEQLFQLIHPGWDGISERRKRIDAEKARKG